MRTPSTIPDRLQGVDVVDSPRTVYARTGLSEATIWRMRQRGEFPEPLSLSPGRKGWRRSVIDAWLETRSTR